MKHVMYLQSKFSINLMVINRELWRQHGIKNLISLHCLSKKNQHTKRIGHLRNVIYWLSTPWTYFHRQSVTNLIVNILQYPYRKLMGWWHETYMTPHGRLPFGALLCITRSNGVHFSQNVALVFLCFFSCFGINTTDWSSLDTTITFSRALKWRKEIHQVVKIIPYILIKVKIAVFYVSLPGSMSWGPIHRRREQSWNWVPYACVDWSGCWAEKVVLVMGGSF